MGVSLMLVLYFVVQPKSQDISSVTGDELPVLTGPYLGQEPPGSTPVPFAPGIVSTGLEHSAAMFTPDGREVWFGRIFPAKIYYMKMIENEWTESQIAPFCDTFKYLYPVLARNGNEIFFSSDRPIEQQGKRRPRGGYDIWKVERTNRGWSEPERLDDNINLSQRNSFGSMATNGSLYFAARITGRSHEIFCSHLQDSTYSIPLELTELNSSTPESGPFVAPDESYLIFASFRGGFGKSDLFISYRKPDGTWTKPKNMGPGINSAYKDEYPYVSPDGKYLFFNSNRPSSLNRKPIEDGPGNIYWVDAKVMENLKPKELK
jgi:hypothetical protein